MYLRSRCYTTEDGDEDATMQLWAEGLGWWLCELEAKIVSAREARDCRLCRQQEVGNAREGRRLSWSKMRQKQHKFPEQGFSRRQVSAGKGCTDAGAKVVPKRGCLDCQSEVQQKKVGSDGSSWGFRLITQRLVKLPNDLLLDQRISPQFTAGEYCLMNVLGVNLVVCQITLTEVIDKIRDLR